MKKGYLFIALAATMLSSCDMDKAPVGSLDDSTAIETVNDCSRFRNGIYTTIRSLCLGASVAYPEIQMDNFQAIAALYGNREGDIFSGNIVSSNDDIESIWAGYYSRIANINYFLEKAEALMESDNFSDSEKLSIRRYVGEAHMARAFNYYKMLEFFSPAYTSANANTPALGIPLVTTYNPTADRGSYPGRSTIAETYALIDQDLNTARAYIAQYETTDKSNLIPMAPYFNTEVIDAFEARLALLRQDYETAVSKATSVINSGIYTLATIDNYNDMWLNDNNNEVIFMPAVPSTEASGVTQIGSFWISESGYSADYVPSESTLAMYDQENDVRFSSFFQQWDLNIQGTEYPVYVFAKYPGNPALEAGTTRLHNTPKPFRLSEMYLIRAEANAMLGNASDAGTDINTLRRNRIKGYSNESFTSNTIMAAIQTERNKELIGEGYRMSDLRRWGLGFSRNANTSTTYFPSADFNKYFVTGAKSVSYAADDYRFVWPIPSAEIEVNPQLQGQQNSGY
jgi:hypothetical protein